MTNTVTNKMGKKIITRDTLNTENIVVRILTEVESLGINLNLYTGQIGNVEEIELVGDRGMNKGTAYISQEDCIGYACILTHVKSYNVKYNEDETIINVIIKPEV